MIREDQARVTAQGIETLGCVFRGLDLDVDGARTRVHGRMQDAKLIFDTAVEFSVVLMAAASCEDGAVGTGGEEFLYDCRTLLGRGEIVEPEFEQGFSTVGFAARGLQELLRIGETHGDADAR